MQKCVAISPKMLEKDKIGKEQNQSKADHPLPYTAYCSESQLVLLKRQLCTLCAQCRCSK